MAIEGQSDSDYSLERENEREKNYSNGPNNIGYLNTQNYLNKESKDPYNQTSEKKS